jgi:hypothetical protein
MPIHRRRLVAGCVAAAAIAVPATAQAAQTLERQYTAAQLGLDARASERSLALAAIERSERRLGLRGSHGALRLAVDATPGGRTAGARPVRMLRFQQTLGGLPVLWSKRRGGGDPRARALDQRHDPPRDAREARR